MKAIGNIYLSWRKGRGSRRTLVGIIKNNATEGVRFKYLTKGVEKATKAGFTPYEGFPDINKEYTENVLRIFGQRIMRTDRHDIDDFFDFWQINKEFRDDPLYMLAYTQGMLPTDNYEFLASFNPVKDLSFVSEISGLSHNQIATGTVKVGDLLTVVKEPLNKQDNYAVKLFKGNVDLGYVKMVHSRVFYQALNLKVTVHKVEQNGKINRIFIKISTPQK